MRYDVAVVGNGPAGCMSAEHAAADTVLIGGGQRRVQCAGLISKSGFERLGVKANGFVLNEVRGAKLISPSGVVAEVDAGQTKAYAVNRMAFDNHLLHRAVDSGVTYVDDWVQSLNGSIELRYGGALKAGRTVLATGTDYTLHRQLTLDHPREFLIGGQYEMNVDCDPDMVELHFTVPDFFAWVIPLGDRARVGLCVKSNPRPHLNSFVKQLKSDGRIKSDRVYSESFGVIPVHDPGLKTQYDGVVTVGDAAGQVKASTGGGIVFGGVSAEHVLHPDYEHAWRREIGWELRLHLMIHRFLARLSDKGKDRLFTAVREGGGSLERKGDMDYASKTLSALVTNPSFMAKSLMNLPWLLADLI